MRSPFSRPQPPPPLVPEPTFVTLTTESKLIATIYFTCAAVALYFACSCSGVNGGASNGASKAGPTPVTTFAAVAAALLLLVGPPDSVDTILRLVTLSEMPLGAIPAVLVLGAALTLAVSFLSIAFATPTPPTPPTPPSSTTPALPSSEATFQLLRRRRSVFPKDYTGAPVPRPVIERALEAANWAPTHGKTEPWRFVVFAGAALDALHTIKREATQRQLASKPVELAAALTKMDAKRAELEKVSAIVAIVRKRVPNAKGLLMPEWEETCAVACAVQNLHLQLTADGYVGYWSSGGVDGWADDPEVRRLVGADGAVDGARDKVLGWFHVGVTDKNPESFQARRGKLTEKVTWL